MNEITHTIILYLAIVMPGDIPDVQKKLPMPSLEECLDNVKAWDERGVTQEMFEQGCHCRHGWLPGYGETNMIDPMVDALQGPPDPTMNALFPQPTHLDPIMLMMKGREMLKDPNRPQYDPENTSRPIMPGRELTPTNQGIHVPWGMMVHGGQPHLQHMAGDVLSGPTHWQAPRPPISPAQEGGAAGMWNLSRGGPHAVDTLGVELHPEAKRMLEILAGPGR